MKKRIVLFIISVIILLLILIIIFYNTKNSCEKGLATYIIKNDLVQTREITFNSEAWCAGKYVISVWEEVYDENDVLISTIVASGDEEIEVFIDDGDSITEVEFLGEEQVIKIAIGDKLIIEFLNEDTEQEIKLYYKD